MPAPAPAPAPAPGLAPTPASAGARVPSPASDAADDGRADNPPSANPTYRIRLVPHITRNRAPVFFDAIERDLTPFNPNATSLAVQIGRFTDRTGVAGRVNGHMPSAVLHPRPGARGGAIPTQTGEPGWIDRERISFLSKVVSRAHAALWVDWLGRFWIRDSGSSSGTFLNHHRLSDPGQQSNAVQIHDGDCIQLGVDYQSRSEQNFRAVLMRVELNRTWQHRPNEYNLAALRQLRALQNAPGGTPQGAEGDAVEAQETAADETNVGRVAGTTSPPDGAASTASSGKISECCICLFSVSVCQSLFIAPCSHAFHYKCIRPLLMRDHPAFTCPMCRTYTDLDADVEDPQEAAELDAAFADAAQVHSGLRHVSPSVPNAEAAATSAQQQAAPHDEPGQPAPPLNSRPGDGVGVRSPDHRTERPNGRLYATFSPGSEEPYRLVPLAALRSPRSEGNEARVEVAPPPAPHEPEDEDMPDAEAHSQAEDQAQIRSVDDPVSRDRPILPNGRAAEPPRPPDSVPPAAPAGSANPRSGQEGGEVGPRGRKRPSPDSEAPEDEERVRIRRPPPTSGGPSRGGASERPA